MMDMAAIGNRTWAIATSAGKAVIEGPTNYYDTHKQNVADTKGDFEQFFPQTTAKKIHSLAFHVMDGITFFQCVIGMSFLITGSFYLRSYVATTSWVLSPFSFLTSLLSVGILWDLHQAQNALRKSCDWVSKKCPNRDDLLFLDDKSFNQWLKFSQHVTYRTWLIGPLVRSQLENGTQFLSTRKLPQSVSMTAHALIQGKSVCEKTAMLTGIIWNEYVRGAKNLLLSMTPEFMKKPLAPLGQRIQQEIPCANTAANKVAEVITAYALWQIPRYGFKTAFNATLWGLSWIF